MDSEGNLNEESKLRAQTGIKIFLENNAANIVTCGWAYREDCNITIADAFKKYILDTANISEKKILVEPNSRDTVGDAFFTKINFSNLYNWRKLIIVTSDYHTSRTQKIFNFIYGKNYLIEVIGSKSEIDESILIREKQSIAAFNNTFKNIKAGDTKAIKNSLCQNHPFYNGKIYPKLT
jgi:uncharacterized SAM-binding protein YcdF (DUF218 family)